MSEAITGVPAANASVSTIPKLSPPQRGRAEDVGGLQLEPLLVVVDLAPADARREASIINGSSCSRVGPITVSSLGTCSCNASNARSSNGSPLRSTAWPTNTIRSLSPIGASGRGQRGLGSTWTPLGITR